MIGHKFIEWFNCIQQLCDQQGLPSEHVRRVQ